MSHDTHFSLRSPQERMNLNSGSIADVSSLTKALELSRSRSPQSDAGYGTSFGSNESRGKPRPDIDIDGLSELLVC